MLSYLDRFGGALNVLGRPLGAGEIKRMIACENIIRAYRSRAQSDNWALWAQQNKAQARILEDAMMAARAEEEHG